MAQKKLRNVQLLFPSCKIWEKLKQLFSVSIHNDALADGKVPVDRKIRVSQFPSIRKLDQAILYSLELASSLSVLLLAFGLVASVTNMLFSLAFLKRP